MELWIDERPDEMARSSGRLKGNHKSYDLQAESSETLMNSGIPVRTPSLQTSDFVQKNEANYKLTISLTLTFGYNYLSSVLCD
jgi:hypothetical protein